MPIVNDREEIRAPLDFMDVFKSNATPEDFVEQLREVGIGDNGWREILPEIENVSHRLASGEDVNAVAAESRRNSLAAAVLGNVLPKGLSESAYLALDQIYFSLPERPVDFDSIGSPGFTDPD